MVVYVCNVSTRETEKRIPEVYCLATHLHGELQASGRSCFRNKMGNTWGRIARVVLWSLQACAHICTTHIDTYPGKFPACIFCIIVKPIPSFSKV